MSKKIEYIEKNLKLDSILVEQIKELCHKVGTDKYAIWLAKEAKKDSTIFESDKMRQILDWAHSVNPNILSINFQQAIELTEKWHLELAKVDPKNILANKLQIDKNRIIYNCKDGKHFFYRLDHSELKEEGKRMGHCVGSNPTYAGRIKRNEIEIISIRDDKNLPHVTIEIEKRTGISRQVSGKANGMPVDKYLILITEYALEAISEIKEDKEILMKLMNL